MSRYSQSTGEAETCDVYVPGKVPVLECVLLLNGSFT
jgi:hypothetical protein